MVGCGRGWWRDLECHVINMSDDVISLAPPLSASGLVVSMFAAWRDNLISRATVNATSHLSAGDGGKKRFRVSIGCHLQSTHTLRGKRRISGSIRLKVPKWDHVTLVAGFH